MTIKIFKTLICNICNKSFIIKDIKLNKNRKCCSRICGRIAGGRCWKGKKRSDSWIKNRTGIKNSFYNKKHLNTTKRTIGISKHNTSKNIKKCNLDNIEIEKFDGILLADGSLTKPVLNKYSGIRESSRLTYSSKFKETILDIIETFPTINFYKPYKKHHTNFLQPTISYHGQSSPYLDLYNQRIRWYPEGKKKVPRDVKITPLSCYWWFIGDGYCAQRHVILCTDAFNDNDIDFLCNKLIDLGFASWKIDRNRIKIKYGDKFVNWLAEYNKIAPQYLYKWQKIYDYCNNGKRIKKFYMPSKLELIERG